MACVDRSAFNSTDPAAPSRPGPCATRASLSPLNPPARPRERRRRSARLADESRRTAQTAADPAEQPTLALRTRRDSGCSGADSADDAVSMARRQGEPRRRQDGWTAGDHVTTTPEQPSTGRRTTLYPPRNSPAVRADRAASPNWMLMPATAIPAAERSGSAQPDRGTS
jgi:hypothetical protein